MIRRAPFLAIALLAGPALAGDYALETRLGVTGEYRGARLSEFVHRGEAVGDGVVVEFRMDAAYRRDLVFTADYTAAARRFCDAHRIEIATALGSGPVENLAAFFVVTTWDLKIDEETQDELRVGLPFTFSDCRNESGVGRPVGWGADYVHT